MSGIRRHEVKPGENLPSISRHYYGTPDHAMIIFTHNPILLSPNSVPPGVVLMIPHIPHLQRGELACN